MKTEIFENYGAFLMRPDTTVNGVDQEHADAFPKWAEEKNNDACWNSPRCSGCSDCSRCSDCSDCSRCFDIENARPVSGGENGIQIPTIENIHSKVLAAITTQGKSLQMDYWHSCGTTHCRGGWVITLAGEAGKKLEDQTSSEFAAMAIYSKSSPIRVSPVRFYESNEKALADIQRCAQLESQESTK